MRNLKAWIIGITAAIYGIPCLAQDTLRIGLNDLESIYLTKNFQVLAQKYEIDIARAQVIQAGLYNNPNFQFTGNIYNPQLKKPFDLSNNTGEYGFNIQQVILLAGKRNKQLSMAATGKDMKEDQYYDLLRTLRFTMRSDFYKLFFLQNSISSYTLQIVYLENLNTVYQNLEAKGAVTLKDAIRIKSLLYTLKAEMALLENQASDINAELQLLIQNNRAIIIPVADTLPSEAFPGNNTLTALIDSAFNNRRDLKMANNRILFNRQNLAFQKATAIPDLSLGVSFDKRGSFVDNASFFTLGIDLPMFNRNQGNIKAAKINVEESEVLANLQQNQVENEVKTAYAKALNTNRLLRSFDADFKAENNRLLKAITENFQKKNIGLLDLTDFYESYKNNIVQINTLQNERMQAIELLQFAVGQSIY